jgi:hypothetical protein
MSVSELWNFVLPQQNDPIQMGFLFVLVGMLLIAGLAPMQSARPEQWERKWIRGVPGETAATFGIEHGNITDLWHAVATWQENLAEMMPNLMLVVGLLGTFLGLGVALNHATNILTKPDALSATGTADSMGDLVKLLQGLGTKFKTSTWGIMGFILLRITSEFNRHDEHRLTWVIHKVQRELTAKRTGEEAERTARRQEQFDKLAEFADRIAHAFAKNLTEGFARHGNLETMLIQSQTDDFCSAIGGLAGDSRATRQAMKDFTDRTGDVIEGMRDGAGQIAESASKLTQTVGELQARMERLLADTDKNLSASIASMSSAAQVTLKQGAEQLAHSSDSIANVLNSLSVNLQQTMNDVKESLKTANERTEKSANALVETTRMMSETLVSSDERSQKLGSDINSSLTGVAEVGRHIRNVADRIDALPDKISGAVRHDQPTESPIADLSARLQPLADVPQRLCKIQDLLGYIAASLPKHTRTPEADLATGSPTIGQV